MAFSRYFAVNLVKNRMTVSRDFAVSSAKKRAAVVRISDEFIESGIVSVLEFERELIAGIEDIFANFHVFRACRKDGKQRKERGGFIL